MNKTGNKFSGGFHSQGCSCCGGNHGEMSKEMTRRKFVSLTSTGALGTVALTGISWSSLVADQAGEKNAPLRRPLVVKPIFTCEISVRRKQTSWRRWGGIQSA